MGSIEDNKALVRRTWEGLAKDNLVAIEQLPPNYVFHLPGGQELRGPQGMTQLLTGFLPAFPEFRITIEDIIAEEDKVVWRSTRTATHKGEWMGATATGKQVTWTYITISRIEDGRIVEEWGEGDYVSLLDQVGAIKAPW